MQLVVHLNDIRGSSRKASIGELKNEICEQFGVRENESVIWDYYKGKKYARLENDLVQTVAHANLHPRQLILLEVADRRQLLVVHSHDLGNIVEHSIQHTASIGQLKTEICELLGVDANEGVLWDYFTGKKCARLEDDLLQTVAHANLRSRQLILLEVERPLLVVHSNDLMHSVEHSISPAASIGQLKNEICEIFGVDENKGVLWDYLNNKRYARLEGDLLQTIAQANLRSRQLILLEVPRTLRVVHSDDLRNSVKHLISPTASIGQLKTEICELFGVDENEGVLWDYFKGNKYARLEDDLSQTVAHAKLRSRHRILLDTDRPLLVVHSNDLGNSVEHSISSTASIGQLKHEICELFDVDEDESVLWAYYNGEMYARLEDDLLQTIAHANLHPRQQILLEVHHQEGKLISALKQLEVMEEQLEVMEGRLLCAVCMRRERKVILLPCRHMCMCEACTYEIVTRSPAKCPMCRQFVRRYLEAFV